MKDFFKVPVVTTLAAISILSMAIAPSGVSVCASESKNNTSQTVTVDEQSDELSPSTILNRHTYDEMLKTLDIINEYKKIISSNEIDWHSGDDFYKDQKFRVMIPTDMLTYEIVFLGKECIPVLYLDNESYGASHADGYQGIMVYDGRKIKSLLATDQLYFYPKSGIIVSQHFGGGFGEIEKHYWLFDPENYDVGLLAVEYHLTQTANIMDLTENEMKEWIKNNAPSGITGEYMTVYDPPVNVDRNFDWSAKKGTKTLKTRESILEEFGKYITDYAEFESFKKEMELFSK